MPAGQRQKGVVLFVHGFNSTRKCWDKMLGLLRSDPEIVSRYDLATWEYPTKWIELNLFGRIPSLKELGRSLGDEIDSPAYRGRRLTLVGHSQGGLVIQAYIMDLLQAGHGSKVSNIDQVIFFATPNEGSMTGWSFRVFASSLFHNPQELTLRVLNPDVADMRAVIQQRVVGATSDSDNAWRIPAHAFSGLQDGIVPEASARGPFISVKRVKGDHFSIIKPPDKTDSRYSEFAELLLDPGGHSERFEIESYETVIRIEPRVKDTVQTGNKNPRPVAYDNYATVKRTVRFSPSNRCRNRFVIQYRTCKEGYVVGHPSHDNEAPPQEEGRWEDDGTCFRFDFTPKANQPFCLEVEVYAGFDAGQRNVHFHLGDHSHYRRLKYALDLSKYVGAGYEISQAPRLYLTPGTCRCRELGTRHHVEEPIPMSGDTGTGAYTWELEGVYNGTVDILWDVSRVLETVPAGRKDDASGVVSA